MNLDNLCYLNQFYENDPRFFNISSIREKNPRSNKKVTMQSPLNQFSETAAAVREILLSQKTCLTRTQGFLFSLFLLLRIISNSKSLSVPIFIFALLTFPIIYFSLMFVLNINFY